MTPNLRQERPPTGLFCLDRAGIADPMGIQTLVRIPGPAQNDICGMGKGVEIYTFSYTYTFRNNINVLYIR